MRSAPRLYCSRHAIINLIHHATTMLGMEPYVHIISLDFFNAFDVARHRALFDKRSNLPLPDCVYSWLLSFFRYRSHITKFSGATSSEEHINSSIVQGSALGSLLFIIFSSNLKAGIPGKEIMKYFDGVTLIVPASNSSTIQAELANVGAWSCRNNQSLNRVKCAELVVSRLWTFGVVIDRYLLSTPISPSLCGSGSPVHVCSEGFAILQTPRSVTAHGLPHHDGVPSALCLPCWWGLSQQRTGTDCKMLSSGLPGGASVPGPHCSW